MSYKMYMHVSYLKKYMHVTHIPKVLKKYEVFKSIGSSIDSLTSFMFLTRGIEAECYVSN